MNPPCIRDRLDPTYFNGMAPNILNDIVGRDHVHYIKDLDWDKRKD